jgi:ferredoxin--NADP+ reductase
VTTAEPPRNKPKLPTASIVRREDLTPEHFKLWLQPAEAFPFQPGQYCTIGVQGIERPYSLVSSPAEPLLELFVELIPPPIGRLTPLLHKLAVGDTVTIRPRAKGVFLLRPELRNHVMVATVTGIAPFVSMIRHSLAAPAADHAFYVLEGASYQDELGYDAELSSVAASHANIEFIATCSRPQDPRNAAWTGEVGRVNTIVERYVRDWELAPSDTCIYACGHPLMIEDVERRFLGKGFQFETESFWKEKPPRNRRASARNGLPGAP